MQQTSAWCEQVSAQLERILKSRQFKNSNRLGRFLSYVVEQTLAHNPATIRSYNIAVEVFGKGPEFDPGDPYVRNIARLVRGALKSYYATTGSVDEIRIDVPAGNYIAAFTSIAGGGVEQVSGIVSVEGGESSTLSQAENHYRRSGVERLSPSVAVIPFRYKGGGADREMVIGEILASGLIAGLSKSPRLNVISWLSTTRFRDAVSDVFTVAKGLDCDYVVSGSYQSRGGRLSIFVEIADRASLEVVWADVIHSTVGSLLSSEAEVVDALIGQTARVVLDQEIRRAFNEPLESLNLHTKLIAGIRDMHSEIDLRFHHVKVQFEQILERHPRHTTVNALLAQWYVLKINRGGGWLRGGDKKEKSIALAHLHLALETDPCHSLALTVMGLVETQFNQDPEKGLELYEAAERYNPNSPLLMALKAAALSYKGKAGMAIEYSKKALKLSPFDPELSLFHTCAAAAYYSAGDCALAEQHAECAYRLNPVHTSNLRTLVAIKIDLGKVSEARTNARKLLSIDPGFTTGSYRQRSPNAGYSTGRKIAERLELAGVPSG